MSSETTVEEGETMQVLFEHPWWTTLWLIILSSILTIKVTKKD